MNPKKGAKALLFLEGANLMLFIIFLHLVSAFGSNFVLCGRRGLSEEVPTEFRAMASAGPGACDLAMKAAES